MKIIEVEGKSIEEAIRKAATELGVEPSDIDKNDVEIVDEGKAGIFGFGVSRNAKIRVSYASSGIDVSDIAREVLTNIFEKMGVEGRVADIHEGESKVYVELESDNSGIIIGKKGKNLEAIQFLINLIVNNQAKTDKKIILDIESYRAKRERTLKKLSRDIAAKVIRSGKPWTLEPMNPFERRLIHLTLQNDNRVTTKSEGQGIYRKVTILPTSPRKKSE